MSSPFDYVNSINVTKTNMMRNTENDELAEKGYEPFLTNRSLSYFEDTIGMANEMNFRSGADKGFTVEMRSTKTRYPRSVGIRPALVCGCEIKPSSSRSAISLRIVAGEIPKECRAAKTFDPTGSFVAT